MFIKNFICEFVLGLSKRLDQSYHDDMLVIIQAGPTLSNMEHMLSLNYNFFQYCYNINCHLRLIIIIICAPTN